MLTLLPLLVMYRDNKRFFLRRYSHNTLNIGIPFDAGKDFIYNGGGGNDYFSRLKSDLQWNSSIFLFFFMQKRVSPKKIV